MRLIRCAARVELRRSRCLVVEETLKVFGRLDQVELDVRIKSGLLLICELKSSMTEAYIYIFERKARFYERRNHIKADRLITILPMIDRKALKMAGKLGIETHSDSIGVPAPTAGPNGSITWALRP